MPPPPPPPRPRPDCIPCTDCPPKIYRNPPDVIVKAGKNVTVDTDSSTDVTEYTVNAKFGHVVIDDDSADFIYGDGTEENPLGINDFEGATARKDGKPGVVPAPGIEDKDSFLKGDGTWAPIVIPEQAQSDWAVKDTHSPAFIRNKPGVFTGATGSKEGTEGFVPAPGVGEGDRFLKGDGTWAEIDIPEQVQSDWTEESELSPAFIRNKPDIDAKIAVETNRAKKAEAAATTEVKAGENATVTVNTATDGHKIYTVNADGKPQEQADWNQNDSGKVDYIKNRPDIEGMIESAVSTERDRATEAETTLHTEIVTETERATEAENNLHTEIVTETERAIAGEVAATTEVAAGNNVTVDNSVAADGHNIYTVTVNECSAAMMDAWLDEVG